MLEGYDDSHGPCHHENQGQKDGTNRDQEDSQEDTLHGDGVHTHTHTHYDLLTGLYHEGRTAVRVNCSLSVDIPRGRNMRWKSKSLDRSLESTTAPIVCAAHNTGFTSRLSKPC